MASSSGPAAPETKPFDEESEAIYKMLKKKVEEEKIDPPPDEMMLHMHVIGYRNEKHRAKTTWEKLKYVMETRKKEKYDTLPDQKWPYEFPEEEILKIWPMFIYGRDPMGHPIMYDKAGCLDLKKVQEHLVANDEQKEMLRYFYKRFLERLNRVKQQISKDKGSLIYKQCCVMDMKELGIMQLNQVKKIVGEIISIAQEMYPESLYRMYLINTGWFFRACWAVISLFVDAQTQKKIQMVGTGWIKTLEKDGISRDQIPKSWGGDGTEDVLQGRCAKFGDTLGHQPSTADLFPHRAPAPTEPSVAADSGVPSNGGKGTPSAAHPEPPTKEEVPAADLPPTE